MIRQELQNIITGAMKEKYGADAVPKFSVEVPENREHGDYATNVAMALAKTMKKPPREIAEEIAAIINNEKIEKVEVASPGFINVRIKDSFLLSSMKKVDTNWGRSNEGNAKTVIVEYFQLNIAKRPHVGHLRSAVIGDALKRMFAWRGYRVISDTHVGDWGTQFGILIYALKQVSSGIKKKIEEEPFVHYEALYNLFHQAMENTEIRDRMKREGWANEETDFDHILEKGKKEFSNLEKGDPPENREIWRHIRAVSMEKLKENARRLGLEEFSEHKGESEYEEDMPSIVDEVLKNVSQAKKGKDGSVIVGLSDEGLDDAVLIKSDGASTYLLRDLATIKYRKKKYNFFQNLYVVDVRQSHHFKQLFRVAELLRWGGAGESIHIEFGLMSLPEGALSSRGGNTISLESLIGEAEKRAGEVIREKNPHLEDSDEVAKKIGLAALKYFDLSHNRKSNIIFKLDDALLFEGNTGPYLQYTYARFRSILKKSGMSTTVSDSLPLDSAEHTLLLTLLRFPEAIEDALKSYMPNILTNYLFLLAGLSNEFYHSHPVLKESDAEKRSFRCALVNATSQTLKNGLSLLGISAPEEM